MFTVTVLPAGQGDCIQLEYGAPDAPHRLLVDGGPARSYGHLAACLSALPPGRRHLDLLVLTHVDADHIEGILRLIGDAGLAVRIDEVWFNGFAQLPPDDELGPAQGEALSALLEAREIPLNTAFGGKAVVRRAGAALPRVEMPGGLVLTVLGPDLPTLRALRRVWEKECRKAGIVAGARRDEPPPADRMDVYLDGLDPAGLAGAPETHEDTSVTNASSIVLLAEYAGRSVLLAGDATPPVLASGLERLLADRQRRVLDVGAVKLPHHASRRNVTRAVLDLVRAPAYLVSSDGKYFGHPDPEAIARVVTGTPGARLLFNYRNEITGAWADRALADRYGIRAEYPAHESQGVVLQL